MSIYQPRLELFANSGRKLFDVCVLQIKQICFELEPQNHKEINGKLGGGVGGGGQASVLFVIV